MSLIYHAEDSFGGPINFDRVDATKSYLNHYQNFLTLDFIAQKSKDGREKAEARAEMQIAERKMKFWQRQVRYDQTDALRGVERLKKEFQQVEGKSK
jgi:hypothetical protein